MHRQLLHTTVKRLNDELNPRAEVVCEFWGGLLSNATNDFNTFLNHVIAVLIMDTSKHIIAFKLAHK